MSDQSIQLRIESALKDKSTTSDQIKFLEETLRESAYKCASQYLISWLGFIGAVLAWILMRNATVTKISLLNLEINDVEIASQILLPVAAFFFYQGQSLFMMNQVIDVSLRIIYATYVPTFTKHGITHLLDYPSFFHIENSFANFIDRKSILYRTSQAWIILLFLILCILPAISLLVMTVLMVISSSHYSVSIASAILVLLFTTRSMLVLFTGFKVYG